MLGSWPEKKLICIYVHSSTDYLFHLRGTVTMFTLHGRYLNTLGQNTHYYYNMQVLLSAQIAIVHQRI